MIEYKQVTSNDENAEQIGKLQGQVSQLEGNVTFLMDAHAALQGVILKIQDREMERTTGARRSDALGT